MADIWLEIDRQGHAITTDVDFSLSDASVCNQLQRLNHLVKLHCGTLPNAKYSLLLVPSQASDGLPCIEHLCWNFTAHSIAHCDTAARCKTKKHTPVGP